LLFWKDVGMTMKLDDNSSSPQKLTVSVALRLESRFRRMSTIFSGIVITLGLVVLTGWVFDVPVLKRVHSSFVTMKANTALLFIVLGTGLWLVGRDKLPRVRRIAALAIVVVAGVSFAQSLFGVNLGIDEIFFRDTSTPLHPGRMSPITALTFLLLGFPLLLHSRGGRSRWSQVAVLLAATSSLVALCGYLYGVSSLYSIGAFSSMALCTAFGSLGSCCAFLFARPTEGVMGLVTSDTGAGQLLRRLLPAIVLVPVVIGWFRLEGELRGLYDPPFGVALMVLTNVVFLAALTWRVVSSLQRSELGLQNALKERSESEALLRLAQQVARVGTFEWNVQTGVNTWTPELETMYGLPIGGFARTQPAWEDLVHPDDRAEAIRRVALAFATGAPIEAEWRVIWPDRSIRWIAGRFQMFQEAPGKSLRLTGVNIDITERKNAEAEREHLLEEIRDLNKNLELRVEERTSEVVLAKERLDGIISIATDAIISIDDDDRITIFNQGAEEIFGWTQGEALGQPLDMLIPERFRRVHRNHLATFVTEPTMARRMAERREVLGLRKNGEQFPAEAAISRLRQGSGHILTVILRDISERVRLEAELLESKKFLQNMLDSSTEYSIIAKDLDRRIQVWNTGAQRLYGYAADELIGKSTDLLHAPEDLRGGRVDALYREALEKGMAQGVFRRRRKDSSEFTARAVITRRTNVEGKAIGYLLISTDISQQEKYAAEQEIFAKMSEIFASTLDCNDMTRLIAEASVPFLGDFCAILIVENHGERLFASHADRTMLPIVEALQSTGIPNHDVSVLWQCFKTRQSVLMSELPSEFPGTVAQSDEHLQLLRALDPRSMIYVPLLAHGRCHGAISLCLRNVTRRYGAEDLRLAEEVGRRFALAIDNALLHEQLKLQATIATHLSEGVCLIRASDGGIVFANPRYEEMLGYETGELLGKHVSNVSAPGEVSLEHLAEEITAQLHRIGMWQGEVENRKKDGSRLWCQASVSSFEHPQFGTVWISVHTDISDRKRMEEDRSRAFKERETLLKEIHHRVKNNLQVISSLLYLQGQRTDHESPRRLLDESRNRIQSIALIHEKLYQSEHLAWIDFGDYLKDLTSSLTSAIGAQAPQAKVKVQADQVYLDIERAIPCALIINELVSNALKHAFPAGRSGGIQIVIDSVAPDVLRLVVSDTGIGFPADIDFKTTTTLGMQLVCSLATQLRGAVEMTRGGGTRFELRFSVPRAERVIGMITGRSIA